MTEFPVYSAAISADESREVCAYILWSHAVAVDAPAVSGELEQDPDGLLVPLVLLHPAAHPTYTPLNPAAWGKRIEVQEPRSLRENGRRVDWRRPRAKCFGD